MQKTLDAKIDRLRATSGSRGFILADAKDADMAFGISAPGRETDRAGRQRLRTLQEYREQIRAIVEQGLVDIMLMSVSTSDVLTVSERLFDGSPVTPAIRANDSTDIWLAGSAARYASQPSLPFRTALLDHAMGGHERCRDDERDRGARLGLYSITLNNDTALDRATLAAYREFRVEAETKGFRHFLEVFPPNACGADAPPDVPRFVNDSIARTLAGVAAAGRPLFLKMPYFGPQPMEELVAYDSSLIVGILGGSAGTTLDSFQLLWEAKKHGARAALFGRRINAAEHQLSFVRMLRAVADDEIAPAEAVRAYHAELEKLGIQPARSLESDLETTSTSHSYASPPTDVADRR